MGLVIEIVFIIVLLIIGFFNVMMFIAFKTMKNTPNESGLSGFEVARALTDKITDSEPHIIKKKGRYLDYYDSNRNVIKLSPEVFDGTDMYAVMIAGGLAALTTEERSNKVKRHNINNFLVILSYLMLIIGAILNNNNVIYFGMVLFIIAFIVRILLVDTWGKDTEDMKDVYKVIRKEKLIKPFTEDEETDFFTVCIVFLARLPYDFINNFR